MNKSILTLAMLLASMSVSATSYKQPSAEASAVASAQSNLQNSNKSSNLNNLSNRNSLSTGDSISQSVNTLSTGDSNSFVEAANNSTANNNINFEAERNTPDLGLSNVQPTIPCAIPINASGVATAFGLGFGTAYIDKACEERELIRLGLASGDSNTNSLANVVLQKRLAEILKPEAKEEDTRSNYEAIMGW